MGGDREGELDWREEMTRSLPVIEMTDLFSTSGGGLLPLLPRRPLAGSCLFVVAADYGVVGSD